jgi:outer membrane protein OmpA-like peptidoglycan-associated protein
MKTLSGAARMLRAWLTVCAVALLAACASSSKPSSAAPVALPFEPAVAQASDGLLDQAHGITGFRLGGMLGKRRIIVDPMLDAGSGQQTVATERLQQRATQRVQAGLSAAEFLPFETASLPKADYLLTGTLTRNGDGLPKNARLLNLALTDLKSGTVVARASSVVRGEGLDDTPLRYYGDSPVLVRDRVIEGYIATTAASVGQPADPYYLKRLAIAPMISTATGLYNAERYPESLAQFKEARRVDGGEQVRVLTGLYLSLAKTGATAEADEAFARLAAYGIANNQLRVKFLFNPGSTTFWADPKVSASYPMWLREIARASNAAKACMTVIGHTSRTGPEAINEALSLQRAETIRQRLVGEVGAIAGRTAVLGRGYHDNIIGTGTDDAVDALDRRVDFKVVPCP